MAISVTSLGGTSGATGATLALSTSTVPAGALIAIVAAEAANAAPGGSFADDAANTYTRITGASASDNNVQANGFGATFYAWNVAALSSQNITYTRVVSGSAASFVALYATGIQTSSDPQDTAVANSATGSSAAPSVTSGTPAASGDLFVGGVTNNGTRGVLTDPSGWTRVIGNTGQTTASSLIYYQVNSGSGALTFNPTWVNSIPWAALVSAFKVPSLAVTQITILMGQAIL